MSNIDITTLSSKGQVVIPQRLRKQLGMIAGVKIVIFTDGSNVLLKPLQSPSLNNFEKLIKKSRAFAKRSGLKQKNLAKIIRQSRHEARA